MESVPTERESFLGTARFEVVRLLGSGGMGVVYEVIDRENGKHIALKTLRRLSPTGLLRFKREFRALADMKHPNLVKLFELVCDAGVWLFTMELVEGVDFVSFGGGETAVNAGQALPSGTAQTQRLDDDALVRSEERLTGGDYRVTKNVPAFGRPHRDPERLRAALAQLAQGLTALHAAGKVHRDIKPSNILVTPNERVVLLDFGLVTEATAGFDTASGVAGTLGYMAPEQLANQAVGPPADWYAVGTVLYEMLTGRLPFEGPIVQVIHNKQWRDPVPPPDRADGVDRDLSELCLALLARQPDQRPDGEQVLARLGARTVPRTSSWIHAGGIDETEPFVGRTSELEELRRMWRQVRDEQRTGVVLVTGPGGIGKTALAHRWLAEPAGPGTDGGWVLAGRCYERESVPFKAFDAIVDDLTRRLAKLSNDSLALLLPRGSQELSGVFTVLGRLSILAQDRFRSAEPAQPTERRKQAFAALAELLGALTRLHPLLLWIDDLQWADDDSLELLRALVRSQRLGALLLLATCRAPTGPRHERFEEALAQLSAFDPCTELSLAPLGEGDATQLATLLLAAQRGKEPPARDTRALVAEAGGNPFLIGELVHFLRVPELSQAGVPSAASAPGLAFGALFAKRLRPLPSPTRLLLELIAVAGEATSKQVLRAAAVDLPSDKAWCECVECLCSERLVRERGPRDADTLEIFHDRIREMVLDGLTEERLRHHHQRLALALEARPGDHTDLLARHWTGAGEPDRARAYLLRAARAASEKLAFDRAAELYAAALDTVPAGPEGAAVGRALGEALANAGRSGEAAQAYREALTHATKAERPELGELVARHLLIAGFISEGLAALDDVLGEVGLRIPRNKAETLTKLAYFRARLALRGFAFDDHSVGECPAPTQVRLQSLHTAVVTLSAVVPIKAAALQAQCSREALDSGDPRWIAEALTMEAASTVVVGARGLERAQRLLGRAEALGRRLQEKQTLFLIKYTRGVIHGYQGRWAASAQVLAEAEEFLKAHRAHYLRPVCPWLRVLALVHHGDLREAADHTQSWLEEARGSGDRMIPAGLTTIGIDVWLARGDVSGAQENLTELLATWPDDLYTVQHFAHALARSDLALYEGDGPAGWHELATEAPRIQRSLFLRSSMMRTIFRRQLGKAALLATSQAQGSSEQRRYLRHARRAAEALARENVGYAAAWGKLIEAAIHVQEGRLDHETQRHHLEEAITALEVTECRAVAVAAKRQLGVLVGGEEGQGLRDAADVWLHDEGVRDPVRFSTLLAPGFALRR